MTVKYNTKQDKLMTSEVRARIKSSGRMPHNCQVGLDEAKYGVQYITGKVAQDNERLAKANRQKARSIVVKDIAAGAAGMAATGLISYGLGSLMNRLINKS